jgi:hypothetical protein
LALIAFRLGQLIGLSFNVTFGFKKIAVSYMALFVLAVVGTKINPYSTAFVPLDIVKKAELIKDTHYFWADILNEIATSEDQDVKVYRKDIEWCPYVYGVGLANSGVSDWPVGDDIYYAGCNQAAAKFYEKNSIELFLE